MTLLDVVIAVHILCTGLLTVAVVLLAGKKNACDHAAQITSILSAQRQLDADIDDVFDRMKRLTSRKGMQAKREERAVSGAQLDGESRGDWKARMRKLKDEGKLEYTEVQ